MLLYNMTEARKHSAKWKKPDTEGHTLYDPIHTKYPE